MSIKINGHMYLLVFIRKCHSVAANVVLFLGGLFLYSFLLFLSVHIEPSVPLLKEKKTYPGERRDAHPQCHVFIIMASVSPQDQIYKKKTPYSGKLSREKIFVDQ